MREETIAYQYTCDIKDPMVHGEPALYSTKAEYHCSGCNRDICAYHTIQGRGMRLTRGDASAPNAFNYTYIGTLCTECWEKAGGRE